MKVSNKVIIELTKREAIQLAKVLPDCLNAEGEDEDFAATVREEICNQVGIGPWEI